jgi:hypothetical protein
MKSQPCLYYVDCAICIAAAECCGNSTNFEMLMSLQPVNKLKTHSNITINTRWESKILYTISHKNKNKKKKEKLFQTPSSTLH